MLSFDYKLDNDHTQDESQWDGLGHVGNLGAQTYYNGAKHEEIKSSDKLGIHNWANRFIGRGVLIDVFRYHRTRAARSIPLTTRKYSLDDLKGHEAQKTDLKPRSILLVRTGCMRAYLAASPETKTAMAPPEKLKS